LFDPGPLDARIEELIERTPLRSFALAVLAEGEPVHMRTFGGCVDSASRFPGLSVLKAATAAMLLRLVEEGVLDLDAPVEPHVPGLRLPEGAVLAGITLRHLLSHTSGLSPDPDFPADRTLEQQVHKDLSGWAAFGPPGEAVWYSNPGYGLAGHVAERATGKDYPALMQELVFGPLGMHRTAFAGKPDVPHDDDVLRMIGSYPAGGALTSLDDLVCLAQALLRPGVLLRADTLEQMRTQHGDAFTTPPRRAGLGLTLDAHRGVTLAAHGGGGGGFGSALVTVPERNAAVVALFDHPVGYGIRATGILDALLELPDEPAPEPSDARNPETLVGIYASPWPDFPHAKIAGYPERVVVSVEPGGLAVDGRPALPIEVGIYRCGQVVVGFPPATGVCPYLTYNPAPIGLVSAWPYRRTR
jgi:CubicO group peptidase (beta-lactamase class C family)